MDNEKTPVEAGSSEPKLSPEEARAGAADEVEPEGEEAAPSEANRALSEEQIQELVEQASQARRDSEEYKDRYVRLLAEFENYKKRALKERSDLMKYQGEKIFQDILETVDNLELALAYKSSDYEKMKAGLEMIHKKFIDTLGRWEVRGQSSIGKEFDPNLYNAISRIRVDDAKPGTIINELKKTYFYKDKLLRVGEVVVAEGGAAAAGESQQNAGDESAEN